MNWETVAILVLAILIGFLLGGFLLGEAGKRRR